MSDPATPTAPAAEGPSDPAWGILQKMLDDKSLTRDASQNDRIKEMYGLFLNEVLTEKVLDAYIADVHDKALKNGAWVPPITRENLGNRLINERINEIDEEIGALLDQILHDEAFKKLEAPGAACAIWCSTPRPAPRSSCA